MSVEATIIVVLYTDTDAAPVMIVVLGIYMFCQHEIHVEMMVVRKSSTVIVSTFVTVAAPVCVVVTVLVGRFKHRQPLES